MNSLEEAYSDMIMVGKFPACVLNISLPPDTIDVNMHPTKSEVRFSDEKAVRNAVYYAVKECFYKNGLIYDFDISNPVGGGSLPTGFAVGDGSYLSEISVVNGNSAMGFAVDDGSYLSGIPVSNENSLTAIPVANGISPTNFAVGAGENQAGHVEKIPVFNYKTQSEKVLELNVSDSNSDINTSTNINISPNLNLLKEESYPSNTFSNDNTYSDINTSLDVSTYPNINTSSTVNTFSSINTSPNTFPNINTIPNPNFLDDGNAPANINTTPSPEFQKNINPSSKVRVIGEIWCNYIIAELYSQANPELLIIDKHAAHERIIYERLKSQNNIVSQFLLSPCEILNTDDEFAAISDNVPFLKKLGFEFDFSGKPYVKVLAVADYFVDLDINDLMGDMLADLMGKASSNLSGSSFFDSYSDRNSTGSSFFDSYSDRNLTGKSDSPEHKIDALLHTLACKAAIKSGDITGLRELQSLAEQAIGNPNIRHCPHGRPVIFSIKKSELERQFKR
jgi:DNA mismatch repair protein MutL